MKINLKSFVIGVIVTLLLTNIVIAEGVKQTIEVLFNNVNITVDGEKVQADNILYNGTTYVPIRAVSEMLGKKVVWNQKTSTSAIVGPEDDKLKIEYASPKESSTDAFLQRGYINLVFDEDMKKISNTKDIYLVDCYGEKIQIESVVPGITAKTNLLIIPKKQLKLDTYYNLFIPSSTLVSVSGKTYKEDINLHFKTAFNVLQGQIVSNKNYMDYTVYLDNEQYYYETNVIGNGLFIFKNINPGKYVISMLDNDGESLFKKEVEVNEKGLIHTKVNLE